MSPENEADITVYAATLVAHSSILIHIMFLEKKKRVQTLLENCGYSVVDLGNLRDGGLVQQAGGPIAGRDFFEKGEYHK